MKITTLSREELERMIKSGEAKQVHLTNVKSVLRPRGSLQKESLSIYLLERLETNYEYWTDPKYSDNPPTNLLLKLLEKNLQGEVSIAWHEFLHKVFSREHNAELVKKKEEWDIWKNKELLEEWDIK